MSEICRRPPRIDDGEASITPECVSWQSTYNGGVVSWQALEERLLYLRAEYSTTSDWSITNTGSILFAFLQFQSSSLPSTRSACHIVAKAPSNVQWACKQTQLLMSRTGSLSPHYTAFLFPPSQPRIVHPVGHEFVGRNDSALSRHMNGRQKEKASDRNEQLRSRHGDDKYRRTPKISIRSISRALAF